MKPLAHLAHDLLLITYSDINMSFAPSDETGKKFLTLVGSAIFGSGCGKFSLKIPNFQFLLPRVKNNLLRLCQ